MAKEITPEVCASFVGVRKAVMKKVWKRASELPGGVGAMTHNDFGKFVREAWAEAKGICKP